MNDDELLAGVAADMGWETAPFINETMSKAADAQHRATVALARKRGVFGVPTVVIGEHLWWGNDRLQFVESHLAVNSEARI